MGVLSYGSVKQRNSHRQATMFQKDFISFNLKKLAAALVYMPCIIVQVNCSSLSLNMELQRSVLHYIFFLQ